MSKIGGLDEQFGAQRTDVFNTHSVLELYIFPHLYNDNCSVFSALKAAEVSQVPIFLCHSIKLMKILA